MSVLAYPSIPPRVVGVGALASVPPMFDRVAKSSRSVGRYSGGMQSAQVSSWTYATTLPSMVSYGSAMPAVGESSEYQTDWTCRSAAVLKRLSGQVALLTSVQPAGRS